MKFVLITGAASGIGKECSLLLAKSGYFVFAGVRQEKDINKFKQVENIYPFLLDVTNSHHIDTAHEKIYSYLKLKGSGLFAIINNAGIALSGPLEILPLEEIQILFDVNVFGYLRIIQKFLSLIRQGYGRIINIGSISGRVAGPFNGPYSASKFAIRAITDSLRMELKKWGIPVVLIEPGRIKTPIWEKSINYSERILNSKEKNIKQIYGLYSKEMNKINNSWRDGGKKGLDPHTIAKVIFKILSLTSPKPRYFIGKDAKILKMLPQKIIDGFFQFKIK